MAWQLCQPVSSELQDALWQHMLLLLFSPEVLGFSTFTLSLRQRNSLALRVVGSVCALLIQGQEPWGTDSAQGGAACGARLMPMGTAPSQDPHLGRGPEFGWEMGNKER